MKKQLKRLYILFSSICLLFTHVWVFPIQVYAYDWNQAHEVTQYFFEPRSSTADFEKAIWQALRQAGCTEECAAGVMGNIWRESHYDPTLVQGMVQTWNPSYGTTSSKGLGLCQWTNVERKNLLAQKADELGCKWTDINVQTQLLVMEINDDHWCQTYHNAGYSFGSSQEFKECTDIDYACGAFCYNWERPGHPAFSERIQYAHEAYDTFKGTAIDNVDSSATNEENGDEKVDMFGVTPESQLTGITPASKLLEGIKDVVFADDSSLNISESYSVQNIRQDLADSKTDLVVSLIRTLVCFVGLVLIYLPMFMILCVLFDHVNTFIDISSLGIITFGKITKVDDELAGETATCITKSKFLRIVVVLVVVGILLVSGSVFSLISKPLLFLYSL